MAGFLQIKTLESDDELSDAYNDDDPEEDASLQKRKKGKKSKVVSDFDEGFIFSTEKESDLTWHIDESIKSHAKGTVSSEAMEEKIKKKIQERTNEKEKESKEKPDAEIYEQDEIDVETADLEEENDEDVDHISSDDDGDSENSEDEEDFFVQPPPQVKHETFTEMNLSRPLLRAINENGFLHPTPIQSSAIPIALLGKDMCACATTGSGKTAAFMLPILERLLFKPKQSLATRVLVLVPTRELAIQVHAVSQSLSKHTTIQICLAAGGLDLKSQEAALRKNPDVIIATPGRLIDHLHNTPSFDLQMIEILVLDEADRMIEEHFADQLKELIRLCPRGRQTMLFSATMTDKVEELTLLSLNQPVRLFIDHNTEVAKTLQQEFIRIRASRENDRLAIVAALCCRTFKDHTLIFLQTKRLAHKLRILLGLVGLNVCELHGDLTMLQRLEALEKYKNGDVDILVATDLAARGLDVVGVKTVISFNMPTTLKSYIHRVGRTARAGKAGRSITLVGEKERKMLKDVVKNAIVPVKNRIIPPVVIDRYKKKIEELEKDFKDILKQEETEKELRIADMQVRKAQNMLVHHDEIMSRPARTFIKPEKNGGDKTQSKKNEASEKKKNKQKKFSNLDDDEKKIVKEQEFQIRQTKRQNKPKRIRAFEETNETKPKGPKKARLLPSTTSFSKDLTDTSQKKVKSMRNKANLPKKKVSGKFKSKGKHRRR